MILSIDTSNAILDFPRLKELQSCGSLLNSTDSFGWLIQQENLIGWTYTISRPMWDRISFKKLIVDRPCFPDKRIRNATHCHIKCYIAKTEMLVGSFNLTAPTIEDLCVLITNRKQISDLRRQFTQHWNALV